MEIHQPENAFFNVQSISYSSQIIHPGPALHNVQKVATHINGIFHVYQAALLQFLHSSKPTLQIMTTHVLFNAIFHFIHMMSDLNALTLALIHTTTDFKIIDASFALLLVAHVLV